MTNPTIDYDRGDMVALTDGGIRDANRYVLEQHVHVVVDDETDEWTDLPDRAVIVDCAGPKVELGRWSLSPYDARLLAESLMLLADIAEVPTR